MDRRQDTVCKSLLFYPCQTGRQQFLGPADPHLTGRGPDTGDRTFKGRHGSVIRRCQHTPGFPGRQIDHIQPLIRRKAHFYFLHIPDQNKKSAEKIRRRIAAERMVRHGIQARLFLLYNPSVTDLSIRRLADLRLHRINIQAAFFQIFENLEKGGLDIDAVQSEISKAADGEISDRRIIKQKQPGLYAVSYHPFGGNPAPDFFRRLLVLIRDMEEVKVRLTPDEGLYVINLTAREARRVLAATDDGAMTAFERSVACIGAATCQVGIGRSQELLAACLARVKKEGFADGVLPAIHISGCPSSCSAHQIGAIGMRGGKKPTPEGPKNAFAIYENGSPVFGHERFGEDLANMLEENIPEFLVSLGRAVEAEGMTYEQFREAYPQRVREIAAQFA